jgi:hypothetical protein
MITYKALQADRRQFLALTGLTLSEFQRLLSAFPQAYQQLYPANQTAEGQPRQRSVGGGCKGRLTQPEEKLLFLLVYLKTYPLQAVMSELFDLSQPRVNYWIHRLLPVLRLALDDLGVLPERDATHFAQTQDASGNAARRIIDATERRRQRPKNPEKQAIFYSGRKKKHCDKNVVLVNTRGKRIDYLSQTYPGKAHDKKIADEEGIAYPPTATLYKDTGFQGYEPAVKKTYQAKKKATPRRTHRG